MDNKKVGAFISFAQKQGVPDSLIKAFLVTQIQSDRESPNFSSETAGEVSVSPAGKILSALGKITQRFGNKSSAEKFSKGINLGTDIAVPSGTTAKLPPGTWKILESFNKASAQGPNNPQGGINRGYGNSVLAQNTQTGEKLRLSHLSKTLAQQGQTLQGGTPIGLTGATGNVAGRTGQHLDLEYYDKEGRLKDILNTIYKNYL